MVRKHISEILLVSFTVLLVGYLVTRRPPGMQTERAEQARADSAQAKPAPDILLHLEKAGLPEKLSGLKGKVVLLDFWATWCGPCRDSIPELEAVYKKYKAQGLQVIGVSMDDQTTRKNVPKAQKQLGFTYPVTFAEDIPGIAESYGSDSIPSLWVIDKEGKLRDHLEGYNPQLDMDSYVAKFVNE